MSDVTNSSSILEFGKLASVQNEIWVSEANCKPLNGLGWEPKYSFREGIKSVIKKRFTYE